MKQINKINRKWKKQINKKTKQTKKEEFFQHNAKEKQFWKILLKLTNE